MAHTLLDLHGVRVLVCAADGPPLAAAEDAGAFVSTAWEHQASLAAIPLARLGSDFLRLRTRLAGDAVQKFVNYRLRLAIVRDISTWTADSTPLRDFVQEANQGQHIWFVADMDELARRLAGN
jgi:hypothetical protein